MPVQFSSSHIQKRALAPLLRSCDHSVVESLYARDRLGHHHLNPWLHLQRGLENKNIFFSISSKRPKASCISPRWLFYPSRSNCNVNGKNIAFFWLHSVMQVKTLSPFCQNYLVKHKDFVDGQFNNYRMCWDSGWTYDKQNISLGDIRLQIAKKIEKIN